MVQVALEQRYPPNQRIVADPLAYRFLPPYLKAVVRVAGSNPVRERLLGLVDSKVPGVRGGGSRRKRAIDEVVDFIARYGWREAEQLGSAE